MQSVKIVVVGDHLEGLKVKLLTAYLYCCCHDDDNINTIFDFPRYVEKTLSEDAPSTFFTFKYVNNFHCKVHN